MDYIISAAQPGRPLPMHLLLLGDENQQLVAGYLPLSQAYLLTIGEQVRGICLVQQTGETAEVMNIAVEPADQGKGLGKALLRYVIDAARKQGVERLTIKTGNSGIGQIALYQQQRFELSAVNYNYFVRAYPHPIWENNIQCKHQLVFELML